MITIKLWKNIHSILDRFIIVYDKMQNYNSSTDVSDIINYLENTAEIMDFLIQEVEKKFNYQYKESEYLVTKITVDSKRINSYEEAKELSSVISYFNYLFNHYQQLLKAVGMHKDEIISAKIKDSGIV